LQSRNRSTYSMLGSKQQMVYTCLKLLRIPVGFAKVCKKSFWNAEMMWEQLSDLRTPWYLKEDDAYIYFNKGDGKWWLDHPLGHGLYIARGQGGENAVPPTDGWESLQEDYGQLPDFEFSDLKDDL